MPKALALESNPLGRINELSSLLSDRYPLTSVLKEWIQNADDAGARRVIVASTVSPSGCTHELLREGTPAVVVLNDGKFTEADSRAIRQFGLNDKVGDGAAIGKFGLGLKSVFHLCEAFFFLSPTAPAADPNGVFNNLVSPWAGTEHHAHWGDVDAADLDRLRSHLEPACQQLGTQWFALWLPLRQPGHTVGDCILDRIYSTPPDELFRPPDAVHFGPSMALLKQVKSIELGNAMFTSGTVREQRWELRTPGCRANYTRWATADQTPATAQDARRGECVDGGTTLWYALAEAWRNERWTETARAHPDWPKRRSIGGTRHPDKARPHAAVVLTRRHGREDGKLHDSPAVFLPLSAGAHVHTPEDAEFLLLRHGCFFVDSGRGGVYAGDGVRGEWNRELMRDGVLPLIVPAVDKLAEVCDEAAKRRLTAAVQNWMKADDREHVCRDGGWAQRWRESGARWETIPNGVRVLEIPAFPEHGLPARVLPGLAGLADDYALVPATEPRLLARDPEPWPDDLLGRVLAVPKPQPLLDCDALGYLVEFVALTRRQFGASARHALAGTIRRLFTAASTRELKDHNCHLVRLVDEVPSGCRRRLSLGGNWPEKTRRAVCGVEANVLIVPDVLEVSSGEGSFDTTQAGDVLKLLESDMLVGRNTNPAAEVIDASADPAAVCAAAADLVLWQVQCPEPHEKRHRTELRSRNELVLARASGTLFGGEAKEELEELAAAVAVPLLVLKGETAKSLLLGHLPEVSAAGVIEVLTKEPDLRPAEARLRLVRRLMAATGDESFRTRRRWAVRYLLHADKELPARDDLYLPGDGSAVIKRLAETVLSHRDLGGRWLKAPELAADFTPVQRKELGLVPLDWDGLGTLLAGGKLPDFTFSDEEQEELLRGLQKNKEIIARLPLHDRTDGRGRVALDDRCYWPAREKAELGSLADHAVLLTPHADDVLAAVQRKAGGTELTPHAVVGLAIQHGPAKHWDTLLGAMKSIGNLSKDHSDKLAATPWLPLSGGAFVAPNQVLHDEPLNGEIADAVKRVPPVAGDPVPQAKLDERVYRHEGFRALTRLFPDRARTLSLLGGLLGREPQFHVGPLAELSDWCEAFRGAPPDIMAAVALVAKAHEVAPEECKSRLLPNLDTSPPPDRIERILKHLRAKHEQMTGPRTRLQRIHDAYLKQAAALPRFAEILPRLLLLNSTDSPRWTQADELCAGVSGVDPVCTLDSIQAEVLGDRVARLPKRELAGGDVTVTAAASAAEAHFQDAVQQLQGYFSQWTGTELLRAWAGALLSLLGDYEPIRKLAAEFLPHGHAPEFVRSRAVTGNHILRTSSQRVLVQVTDPRKPVQVVNLLGQPKTVAAVTVLRTLLIGYGLDRVEHRLADRSLKVNCLDLRVADPNTGAEFRAALAETGNLILRVYYGVPEKDVRFEDALDSFRRDDEYGLQFAQVSFLNEGGDALRNRGLARPTVTALAELLQRFKAAETRKAQEQIAEQESANARLPGDSALKQTTAARDALRGLVETDLKVQLEFLRGVRERLYQAGYTSRSVLFELFQNADDAYVEKGEAAGAWFRFAADGTGATISHDGRPINRPRPDDAYDLRKMLALHHSDKGADGQEVTGKFGLGFKSVFLVCDEPRIVSGRLAVRVVGGSYPMPLSADEAKTLRARLPTETSTLFRLPVPSGDWCEPFRRLAHLLPVFARHIREVRINQQTFYWKEGEVLTTATARMVVSRLDTADGPRRALVVRCGELGDVLFGLTDDGFAAMPGDVPSAWVTAPTAEEHRLGYVVNARELPIDIGRSQVAWAHPDAGRVLRGLATVLGEALVALFDAGAAGLGVSAGAPAVWRSFWEVVKITGERGELREGLMWGPHGAARRLFTARQTLPTGLDAPGYSELTSLEAVLGVVAGILDQQADVFLAVTGWASFRGEHPPGALVAASQVGDLLTELPRVDLASAVGLEMKTPFVDPTRAAALGHVLSRDRLNKLSDRGGEVERVKESLKGAQFRNANNVWVPPAALVSAEASGEEGLRAAFAPPDRTLAADYAGTAVDFFQACRGDMQVNAETLEAWVHAANTDEKQKAALVYLSRGELRQQVLVRLLASRSRWTWLRQLTADQMRQAGLSDLEQAQLAAATSPPTAPVPPPPPPPAASRVLERISSWWEKNQTAELKDFYDGIYPGGRRPAIAATGSLRDAAVRKEWLKLLVTGAVQTIGRTTPEQNRDFLHLCDAEGWLDLLCDPKAGPNAWLQAVERYVDNPKNASDSIRYFYWLRHFVGIDTIARHLDAYVASFLSVRQFKAKFTPAKVLTSRGSTEFQFGGPDAPTLTPILGIGASFVLRELVRSELVKREDVHPYCFPPTSRLRARIELLGWRDDDNATPADRSRSIHAYLEDHHPSDPTFGGAFDIPLLTCPEDWFCASSTTGVSTTPSLFPGGGN